MLDHDYIEVSVLLEFKFMTNFLRMTKLEGAIDGKSRF